MLAVASVPRAAAFYALLGFEIANSHHVPECGEEPVCAFSGMHAALSASGVAVGAITYPFYCPNGEFRATDPDGYVCVVTHT